VGKGDLLVLAEWDRATRSMLDGVQIIERIHARGALLKVLDAHGKDPRVGTPGPFPRAASSQGMGNCTHGQPMRAIG
jgi:Resolvase, N terminal domain